MLFLVTSDCVFVALLCAHARSIEWILGGTPPPRNSSKGRRRRKIDAMDRNTRRRSRGAATLSERFSGSRLGIRLCSQIYHEPRSTTDLCTGSRQGDAGCKEDERGLLRVNLHADKTACCAPPELGCGVRGTLSSETVVPFPSPSPPRAWVRTGDSLVPAARIRNPVACVWQCACSMLRNMAVSERLLAVRVPSAAVA